MRVSYEVSSEEPCIEGSPLHDAGNLEETQRKPASLWFSFAFHAGFLRFPLGFLHELWFSFAFHAGFLWVSSRFPA